ncbi:hypothetical protein ACFQ6C_25865 [Streptomyces sp. NPDC056454]|uniref:hypothetical protein n=1 Tax=Streptomyces sp. NPDC056454 TaxID=3345823 RepID=UPI00369B273C
MIAVQSRAADILRGGGMDQADFVHEKDGSRVTRSGFFLVRDGDRAVSVGLMVADSVPEEQRNDSRDAMFQTAYAAFTKAGWQLSQNSFGTLRAAMPRSRSWTGKAPTI